MTLPAPAQQTLEAFNQCASWEQRARLLMQWGQRLTPIPEALRTDANRVHGCESKVWLLGEYRGAHWHFLADSEARLLRGLLAVLLDRVNGLEAQALRTVDITQWYTDLGLGRQLSPSRSNGLNAVLQRIWALTDGPAAS